MPRVTVIIATYNWSTVLPYSIGSVLGQTFHDFELLVVGDGCTDDSEQVVHSIRDDRVHWVNLPDNSGHQTAPNNEGLRRARGEFIAFLGHDDLWLPHHLEVMVGALDRSQADLAYSLIINVAPGGDFVWPSTPNPAAGSFASPLGIVHRKRVTDEIGGWKHYRNVSSSPDAEMWQRAREAGYAFEFVPRLTGIKFAAGHRRNVYRTRPCHEQAAWSRRIESDPQLEFRQFAAFLAGSAIPDAMPYRFTLRNLVRQTAARLRMRRAGVERWPWQRRRGDLDDIRRFKGL